MKKLSIILMAVIVMLMWSVTDRRPSIEADASPAADQQQTTPFEKAVELIKKYETLHQPRHWPLVGYGHKVLPGEKYNRRKTLSETEADSLLRKDLLKNCAVFREFGADSLLLGVLAYNIGSGATKRSTVVKKLKQGNRDIRTSYLAHCRYRGKVHSQIRQRRTEEFDALFIEELPAVSNEVMSDSLPSIQSQNQNLALCTFRFPQY